MNREDNEGVNDGLQHGSFEGELQMEGLITHTSTGRHSHTLGYGTKGQHAEFMVVVMGGGWMDAGVDWTPAGPD